MKETAEIKNPLNSQISTCTYKTLHSKGHPRISVCGRHQLEISKEQAPQNLCNELKSNNQLLERTVQIGPPLGQLFLPREE